MFNGCYRRGQRRVSDVDDVVNESEARIKRQKMRMSLMPEVDPNPSSVVSSSTARRSCQEMFERSVHTEYIADVNEYVFCLFRTHYTLLLKTIS